jgi:hypothetical protein
MRVRTVYFARCLTPFGTPMGAIKIGCSYGHEDRLRAVAANQPYSLQLIGAVPGEYVTEAMVHLYLKRHRISGEFFHENRYVMKFVESAVERGTAFQFINDVGAGDNLPDEALNAFMEYHGLTLEMVCEYLERDPAIYRGKAPPKNRKLLAAALIMAQRADGPGGRYVYWPADVVHGLLGHRHRNVRLALPEPIKDAA